MTMSEIVMVGAASSKTWQTRAMHLDVYTDAFFLGRSKSGPWVIDIRYLAIRHKQIMELAERFSL